MSAESDAERTRAYLERLCDAIDGGERLVRWRGRWGMILPSATVGLAIGVAACAVYGAPGDFHYELHCFDGTDDDHDGKVDCDDEDCEGQEECQSNQDGGASEVCDNQKDDDSDGKVDCDDSDCVDDGACGGS